MDGEHIQTDQIIINTNNNKDKIDKTAEAEIIPDEINHNKLTQELINLKYIDEKDQMSPFYFDNLFNEYLLAGRKYVELFSGIHYIVPDENGNDIKNRFAYFKSALESNFSKLENLGKDLYPDDDSFWKDFETNKVKDMAWMFGIGNTQYNNGARSKLQSLDVSNFNTSNVTNMEGMFQYLELIPELDVSGFDTKNVENMQTMFQRCEKITSLDLSNFDTSKVTTMGWMFYGCYNLRTIYASENFVTNNVTLSTNMFLW